MFLKQVLTEVSLPCMCLESFGSPVILSSSFPCPYPNLPSFADKKDKFYQHTTMKERFRTSAQSKLCLMAQDYTAAYNQGQSVLYLTKRQNCLGNIFEEIHISEEMK